MLFSFSACSDTSNKKDKDDTDAVTENSEVIEDTEATTTTEETTAEPTPTPEPDSWFKDQGLTITPQGDFELVTEFVNGGNLGSKITVASNVQIQETTEGVKDGYKVIQAYFTLDFSKYFDMGDFKLVVDDRPSSWISVFDRYTGITYEPGGVNVPIEYNGQNIEVKCDFEWSRNETMDVEYCLVYVLCPVDYDGAVFYVGHGAGGASKIADGKNIDYSAKLYTIDELPFYDSNGFPYTYFSANDK